MSPVIPVQKNKLTRLFVALPISFQGFCFIFVFEEKNMTENGINAFKGIFTITFQVLCLYTVIIESYWRILLIISVVEMGTKLRRFRKLMK